MSNDSQFRTLEDLANQSVASASQQSGGDAGTSAHLVTFTFDGIALTAPAGFNLAAALMLAGIQPLRHTPVSGAPRAPFCMMGTCYECLVEIEGETVQACMHRVVAGGVVSRAHQPTNAAPQPGTGQAEGARMSATSEGQNDA